MEKIDYIKEYLNNCNDDELLKIVDILNEKCLGIKEIDYIINDIPFISVCHDYDITLIVKAICDGNYHYKDEFLRSDMYDGLKSCSKQEFIALSRQYIDEIVLFLVKEDLEFDIFSTVSPELQKIIGEN